LPLSLSSTAADSVDFPKASRCTSRKPSFSRSADAKSLTPCLYSYIRKIFEGYVLPSSIPPCPILTSSSPFSRAISLVPILVGSLSTSSERGYGALLAPYLADPSTLFIISSDFCHWGSRFRYTHYQPPLSDDVRDGTALTSGNVEKVVLDGEIWEGIEKLDRLAMETIAFSLSPSSSDASKESDKLPSTAHSQFASYLKATKNSICGRHPIGVLLGALSVLETDEEWKEKGMRCEWVRYEQSSQVRDLSDSSVSYASAFIAKGV
jgi:AmmeMemoRadiSam system protein B